jgi:hypothetical protein
VRYGMKKQTQNILFFQNFYLAPTIATACIFDSTLPSKLTPPPAPPLDPSPAPLIPSESKSPASPPPSPSPPPPPLLRYYGAGPLCITRIYIYILKSQCSIPCSSSVMSLERVLIRICASV